MRHVPNLAVWDIFNSKEESKAAAPSRYEKQRGKALTSWICCAPPRVVSQDNVCCSTEETTAIVLESSLAFLLRWILWISFFRHVSTRSRLARLLPGPASTASALPSHRQQCWQPSGQLAVVLSSISSAKLSPPSVPPTRPQNNLQHRHHHFVRCLFELQLARSRTVSCKLLQCEPRRLPRPQLQRQHSLCATKSFGQNSCAYSCRDRPCAFRVRHCTHPPTPRGTAWV